MSNPSSFSSISFEAESVIKFKKLAREQNKTHSELMEILFDCHKYCLNRKGQFLNWSNSELIDRKNELMK